MKKLLLTALCLLGLLGLFSLNAQEPETVTVGSSSGSGYKLPVNTGQAYSVSQQIYKASEIGKTGKISKITFNVNTPGSAINREWNIYLQNTTRSTIENNNSWFSVDNDDMFFNGTVSIDQTELIEITLDRKFEYTGDNLMLCVYDKTGSMGSSDVNFHHYTTSNTAVSYYSSNDKDPSNMNGNGSTRAFNNCITLTFAGAGEEEIKPEAPTGLTAKALSDTEIELSWTVSEKAKSYKVYKKGNETPIASAISATTYVVKDLTPATNYCFTVTAVADQESEHSNEACAETLSKLTTFAFDFEEGSFYNNTLEGLRVYQGNEANPKQDRLNWGTPEDRNATTPAPLTKYFAGKDGSRAVYSMSIDPDANTEVLENYYTPDNYIVTTKSYLITKTSTLEWDIRQAVDGKEDNYAIVVSEDGVTFRELWYERYSNGSGATKAISLAKEEGKELYIGFRHYEITYGGALCLDNVKLVTESTVTPEDEIDPNAPRIPTKVEAVGWSETTLKVRWNAAQNAESYNIYSADTLVVKGVTATEYTVENLKPGTNYCFQVTAVKGDKESAKSSEACDFTFDAKPTVLAAPTNLKATYASEFDIKLTWDKVENAKTYRIYQDGQVLVNAHSETEWTVTNIDDKNATYCFEVTACNGDVESPKSNKLCTSIAELENPTDDEQPEDPETPSDSLTLAAPVVTATATSDTTIVLTWNKVEGAESYNVYQGANTTAIATAVKDTTYTVSGLKAETEYTFTVTAVNAEGESAKSAEAKATTLKGEVSIEELSAAFNVYPNPVKDELFIATEMNVKEIAICDIYGRQTKVYSLQTTDSVHSIDVAELNSGIYFVKVVTNNGEIVKRFVKE